MEEEERPIEDVSAIIEEEDDWDAQGNVIVVCRFRPLNEKEKGMDK